MDKPKTEQIILKNVSVKYAKLIRPGDAYDEGDPDLWSVNMYVSAEDRERLMSIGCSPKVDKNHLDYFLAKRSTVNKAGESVKPPALVDHAKRPFTEEVGNGSVCNIAVTPFPWSKGKKGTPSYREGVMLYLNAVQVITHVAMSSGVDAFEVVDVPDSVIGGEGEAF